MDCVEVCPVDCFYEGENMLVINPDECIDCGVCEPECPIEPSEVVDGRLILQGAEDGLEGVRDGIGWSLSIDETSGDMVLTGSGADVAFVIFGACTPL